MIIYTNKNLFLSPAQTLVNTVNTVGIMGKGIAKDFKKFYPQMFKRYKYLCDKGKFQPGQLMLSKEEPEIYRKKNTGNIRKRWVLNFPTKKHWRNKSKIEYIEMGLKKFVEEYKNRNIESISFPQLGTGNGGLKWEEVKEIMEYYLSEIDIPVYIHIYQPNYSSYTDKEVEKNLNTDHDIWKTNIFLKRDDINLNNSINVDGIILPGSEVYRKNIKFESVKYLSVVGDEESELIWLQENTREIEERIVEQLSIFNI